MSRYSNSGTRENHSKLSIYSKISIQEILQDPKMSYCLHPSKHSFCGDGIIQEGEVILKLFFFFHDFFCEINFCFQDCDCGSMENCLSEKSCCVQPGGGPKNQNQCTWNSVKIIKKHCIP